MEKLYTIPVNMAFEACAADHSLGCPFCRIYNILEENELDLILGASMMEPNIRIKTNELGFCPTHFEMMLRRQNRLGLALMLESHLDFIRKKYDKGDFLTKISKSCYVCGRIEYSMERMLNTAVLLWDQDPGFKPKLAGQHHFCLPHLGAYLEAGKSRLNRRKYAAFQSDVAAVVEEYFDELRGDVSWFCKKFDYRYDAEPWYNSKDAPERAIKFLSADLHTGDPYKKNK